MKKSNIKISKFRTIKDKRGKLIVFLTSTELHARYKKFGQIYFVTFQDVGVVRGNHYHKHWHEWFGITEGKALIVVKDLRTGVKKQITLSAKKDRYTRIQTGPYVAHAIKSLAPHTVLLSYADSAWNTKDTYYYKLI